LTIEIHKPELQALIRERMKTGGFHDVEDALIQALTMSAAPQAGQRPEKRTGADLIAAVQASPYREIEIEPARSRMPVRAVTF